MPDLTPVNDRIVTSQAPQSSVSPGQIAAPYRDLANALDQRADAASKVGGALETVAETMARKAGEQAVTQDNDGNLIIQKAPIIGPASQEYYRAAHFTYVAQMQPKIESTLLEMRLAHPNDPQAFQAAAKGYGDGLLSTIDDPALKNAVGKIVADNTGQNYRSSLIQADATNLANFTTSTKSRISDDANKLSDLAFQGGTDTPEYAQLHADLAAKYQALGNDPRAGYPQARIDSELSEISSQHKVQAIAGMAVRMQDAGSPTAKADAKRFLIDKVYGDSSLNLTMAQRHQAVTLGLSLMEARTADSKALIDGNKKLTEKIITGLGTTAQYDPTTVNDQIERSKAMGDVESYYRLTFAKGMSDWNTAARSVPLPEAITALKSLQAQRLGGTLEDRIIGAESGGNPNAKATGSTATGAGQFTNGTWLDVIRKSKPELAGKSDADLLAMRSDPALSREMVRAYAEQNRTALKAAGVNDSDGALYLSHFLGAGDAIKVLQAAADTPLANIVNPQSLAANPKVFGANKTAGDLGMWAVRKVGAAGASPAEIWFGEARQEQVNRFQGYLKEQAGEYVGTFERALGKGIDPSPEWMQSIHDVLQLNGSPELRQRVETALQAHYGVERLDQLPANVRQSFVGQLKDQAGANPIAFQVHQHMEETINAQIKGMADAPYTTAYARHLAPAPEALRLRQSQPSVSCRVKPRDAAAAVPQSRQDPARLGVRRRRGRSVQEHDRAG